MMCIDVSHSELKRLGRCDAPSAEFENRTKSGNLLMNYLNELSELYN
jgi:hypothetical protein